MAIAEQPVRPLSAGDRLTRDEFLRVWEAHPEIKLAELIGGIVYMPSPLSVEHGDTDSEVGGWLLQYKAHTPGTATGHNTTSFILDEAPQPDLNLRVLPEFGGTSWIEDRFLAGVPEFLAEICRSSAAYDLHQKLELYQAAGIPEYLTVLLFEKEIRWHILVNGTYQVLPPDAHGIFRSQIFPGLWLNGSALLAGNSAQVLATLDEGLKSPGHQDFINRIASSKRS